MIKNKQVRAHGTPVPRRAVEQQVRRASPCLIRPMTDEEKIRYGVANPSPAKSGGTTHMAYIKYQHVTKDFVEAEFAAGKTAAQIEREAGMPANSLYARMKSWNIRSPHSNQSGKPSPASVSAPAASPPSSTSPAVYGKYGVEFAIRSRLAARMAAVADREQCAADDFVGALKLLLATFEVEGIGHPQ